MEEARNAENTTMPRLLTETDAKALLGVETFNNVTKDGLMQFMRALPDMDRALAEQVLAQMPAFADLAQGILGDIEQSFAVTVADSARSHDKITEVELKIIAVLDKELDRDLTPEQRARVLDDLRAMYEAADRRDAMRQGRLERLWEKRTMVGLLVGGGLAALALRSASASSGAPRFDVGAVASASIKALARNGASNTAR